LAMDGRDVEARNALRQFMTLGQVKTIAQWKRQREEADTPYYRADRERLVEGLRKAGMPEE